MFTFNFCSLLILTGFLAQGHGATADFQVDSEMELSVERELKHASIPVRLIRVKDMKARVEVFQAAIGDPHTCMDGPESTIPGPERTVDRMFATFMHPETLEPACGAFKRNANACFSKPVWIGCDPKTKIASIDVYYRDETFDLTMTTDNPKIGRCKAGQGDTIKRAIKYTATFDCEPSEPGICSDSVNNCPEGSFCNFSEFRGYECKKYVNLGQRCGGFTIAGEQDNCDPTEGFCYYPFMCIITDVQGICEAYHGDCKSDVDCGDESKLYCDEFEGKCKELLKKGYCCDPSEDLCGKGLACSGDGYFTAYTCQPDGSGELGVCDNELCGGFGGFPCDCACEKGLSPTCVDDPNDLCDPLNGGADCLGICQCKAEHTEKCLDKPDACPEGTFCSFSELRGYECKRYAPVGSNCGGFTIPGEQAVCDPRESFCYEPSYCTGADVQGTCQAFHGPCKTVNNCRDPSSHYCDTLLGQCKERLSEGLCCEPGSDQCADGLECVGGGDGEFYIPYTCKVPQPESNQCDLIRCPAGTFCNYSPERGYECKKFSPIDEICGGKTRLGETNVCNPDEAYCLDTRFCLVSDVLGVCAAYLGQCSSDQDCDDSNNQYCAKDEGKCKRRLEEGACCFEGVDQCGPGLECIGDGYYMPFQCKPAVQSGVCNNQFCGGIAAFECDCLCKDGQAPVCVDDPNDGCDPAKGGADCGGICQCQKK